MKNIALFILFCSLNSLRGEELPIQVSIPPGQYGIVFLSDEPSVRNGSAETKTEEIIGFINTKPLNIKIGLTAPERKMYPHPNATFKVLVKYDWESVNTTENTVHTNIGFGLEFTYSFLANFKTTMKEENINGVATIYPIFELMEWAELNPTPRKTVINDEIQILTYPLARTEGSVRSITILHGATKELLLKYYKEWTGRNLEDRLLIPLE